MRLFLSSYRAGRHDDKLLKFLGSINKVAVITNAKDYKDPEERKIKVEENLDYFQSLGIRPTEIDLRPYFHKKGAEELFAGHDFVWLAGGNAFLLRRALKYSGIDKFLTRQVKKASLIYGGESAGAIMAAPTLRGSEDDSGHEDDPNYTPAEYKKEILWDGLDFIDFVLVPHYKNPDIGESIEGYICYLKKRSIPFEAITDEEAFIVDGGKREFLR
jgi:dipeptidase E